MEHPVVVGLFARISQERAKNKDRSVNEQEAAGRARCAEQAELGRPWDLRYVYKEKGSASRYAKKQREDWPRLQEDIAAGKLDIVQLWECQRGSREEIEWFTFLKLCRETNTLIDVITHERTYDPRIPRDWETLALEGIKAVTEVETTRGRVRRTKSAGRGAGLPDGKCPAEYTRFYHPQTKRFVKQEPNELAPRAVEIIRRIAKGDTLSTLAREYGLSHKRVRQYAVNPVFIGKYLNDGQMHDAVWPPLSDEPDFVDAWWRAHRIVTDPKRRTTVRPGRVQHFLSYVMVCARCGAPTHVMPRRQVLTYTAAPCGHVVINKVKAENYVSDVVVAWATDEGRQAHLLLAEDDASVVAARMELARLQAELDAFCDQAAQGVIAASSFARIEAGLRPRIEDARRRTVEARTPPVLRELLDPERNAREVWDHQFSPAAKKDIVRFLFQEVTLRPSRARGGEGNADYQRIGLRWRD